MYQKNAFFCYGMFFQQFVAAKITLVCLDFFLLPTKVNNVGTEH